MAAATRKNDIIDNFTTFVVTDYPNATESATATESDVMHTIWFHVIFGVFYSIIFVVGICGNSLVAYVVVRSKPMRTITNIFITNLALSDILMCSLAVPITPLAFFMNRWEMGDALCHILPMTLGVSVYVSTLTSTAIALDRFFVIVHPFKPRMKTGLCLVIILAIWVISVSISLPLGIYAKVIIQDGKPMCVENWPHVSSQKFFTFTSLLLQYVVPCALISFCYIKVWRKLSNRNRSLISARSQRGNEMELRRKRRTNKMLVAMISIFVICWMPLNAVLIVMDHSSQFTHWPYHYLIFFIAHVIAMSSTIYNPFLYAWMNENFNKEFKTVLPACFFRTSRHCYLGNTDPTQYTSVDTTNHDATSRRVDIKGDLPTALDRATEVVHMNDNRNTLNGKDSVTDANTHGSASNGDVREQIELKPVQVSQ